MLIRQNPLWALCTPLLIPVSQFAVSPLFTSIGLYQYLSPILLVYLPTTRDYELHHASSFDYLFLWQQLKKTPNRKRLILLYYVEGLLHLIRLIEEKKVSPDVHIHGTTYFLNTRTAKLLGLSLKKPDRLKQICQYLNFIDLLWMYSLCYNTFKLPPLNQLGCLQGSGQQLVERKNSLLQLHRKLMKATTPKSPAIAHALQ